MEAIRGSQKSLILVARQLGIHIGPNDIPERFKIDDRELTLKEMSELAKSFDLKAKATKISENELLKLLKFQSLLYVYNKSFLLLQTKFDETNKMKMKKIHQKIPSIYF